MIFLHDFYVKSIITIKTTTTIATTTTTTNNNNNNNNNSNNIFFKLYDIYSFIDTGWNIVQFHKNFLNKIRPFTTNQNR